MDTMTLQRESLKIIDKSGTECKYPWTLKGFRHGESKALVPVALLVSRQHRGRPGEETAAEERDSAWPRCMAWLLNAQGTQQAHTFFPGCLANGG